MSNSTSNDLQENHPKISIVTPTYNQGQYIEKTILSVLNQNYPNLEYIVIDGGSQDETINIIKKYEHKITYWVSEKDRGQSHAINKGAEKVTGEIFNWLNSDDTLSENVLFIIAENFNKYAPVILTGSTKFVGDNAKLKSTFSNTEGDVFRSRIYHSTANAVANPNLFQPSTFLHWPSVKKYFPLTEELHYAMDTELYSKILMEYGFEKQLIIDPVFANYLIHDESKTGSQLDNFFLDLNSIFLQIAKKTKDKRIINKILYISNGKELEGYNFDNVGAIDIELYKEVSINYIFKFILKYYNQKNSAGVKYLTKGLDKKYLLKEDQITFDKIQKRKHLLPIISKIKKIIS